MGSTEMLAFVLTFAWMSIILAEQCKATIHVKFEKTSVDYFIDVKFTAPMLQRFHSCLCNGSATDCVAKYNEAQKNVIDVYNEGRVANDQISLTYNCTNNSSRTSIICEQQRPQNLPDFSSGNVLSQSFLITQSPYDSTCIVFIWQSDEENMTYYNAVSATNCRTNCACTRSTTAAVTSQAPISQISQISIEPKPTGATSKTTIPAPTAASTTVETSSSTSSSSPPTPLTTLKKTTSSPTTAGNLENKTSDEDTLVGVIIGVLIAVIIVVIAIVIGVIIWRRGRAASGLSEKMDHQIDTPKESSEARTLGPKSENNRGYTSDTQLPSTDNAYLEGETNATPHKTKHQQDAIPTGISKNGTKSLILNLNQQSVDEKNVSGHDYPKANRVSDQRNDFRKSDNSTFTNEDVSGNKAKQPKRNTVEDDFGYAFAEEPPDEEMSQNLNSSIALSTQNTGFTNRGRSGEDCGYAGVDVDVVGGGDGETRPNYQTTVENTLLTRRHSHDYETKSKNISLYALAGNVRNSDRSSGGGEYGYSSIGQEFSKSSKVTPATGLVDASVSRNSDYEYPVMENDCSFVSVNGNTQNNDNSGIMDTNIDDEYSTTGKECHLRRPTSDTSSNPKNVYAKLHEEKREMHNPYNSLLSPKEDPKVRKPMALPSQNNLPTNQSARYFIAQPIPNASSNRESDKTISVIDLVPSTNSLPVTNTQGAHSDPNNGVYRIKPFDGDDEYTVVCKKKP